MKKSGVEYIPDPRNLSESSIEKLVALQADRVGMTLFRHNVGLGWTGQTLRFRKPTPAVMHPGDVLIRSARPLHAGLVKGGSDRIGWTTLFITPDMVGARIAVFTGVEVKATSGRESPEQITFKNNLVEAGGIAFVARSPSDVTEGLTAWKTRIRP